MGSPGLARVPGLLLRYTPFYVRHFIALPYRDRGAAAGLRRRHQIAIYDSVLELMLRGYAELAGRPLLPGTGRVAVMLTRIGFAFDDEYERRESSGGGLEFVDVFAAEPVQQRVDEWRQLMRGVETYAAIRDFLYEFVTTLYGRYRDTSGEDFQTLMRSATIDSGGLLVTLAHVVARLHATVPSEAVIEQFSSLGVAAKLADDVLDLSSDVAEGRSNLVLTVAAEYPAEEARVRAALTRGSRLPAGWWRRHCPATYGRVLQAYEQNEAVLTSRWLRFASRLMWTPVLFGHRRAVETRGRI
jgi:hypothetical protein